jgi:hypothetical protein
LKEKLKRTGINMKKSLLFIPLLAFTLSNINIANSQGFKQINPNKVKSVKIFISCETDEERINKLESLFYKDCNEVIKEVKDIRGAELYCTKMLHYNVTDMDNILYGEEDYWASFKQTNLQKLGDCDDGAIAAASLLYDDGFPPYFLILNRKKGKSSHMVFLYKDEEGRYGSIGINEDDNQRPNSKNISDLVKKLGEYDSYKIYDGSKIFPNAIHDEGNYKKFIDE